MTGAEIQAAHEALETGAALALGNMLFEFSRLDMNLGLCLVWAGDPEKMQSLSRGTGELAFNEKLNELAKLANAKLPAGSKRHTAYSEWIRRAHIVRQKRNDLVHGRWGGEVQKGKVVNVVGLPTSSMQCCTEYTIDELQSVNDELRNLLTELGRLRTQWPL